MLERRLAAALGTMPTPEGLARLDGSVGRATTAESMRRTGSWRPFRHVGRRALVLGLLAGAGVLTAAAGGSTLLDRFMSNDPGSHAAWSRAERLGLRTTIDGEDVTLERAYLDANEFLFVISTEGDLEMAAEVWVDGRAPDDWGLRWAGSGRVSVEPGSPRIYEYSAPPDAGAEVDVVVQVREQDSPMIGDPSVERPGRFAFVLPNQGGGRWSGAASATASGVEATLDNLVVTPASMEGHMTFDLGERADAGNDWSSTEMVLLHDGERIDAGIGLGHDGSGGFNVTRGVDDWAGEWTIRVDGLTRFGAHRDGDGPMESLVPEIETIEGPWVFEVTIAP
jgi:hypothetical protein